MPRSTTALFAAGALVLTAGCTHLPTDALSLGRSSDVAATPGNAGAVLDSLLVAPEGSDTRYERDTFEHWIQQPGGRHCDTRETVLRRDGHGVRVNTACTAISGVWTSVYTGQDVTDSSDVDVDHLVPLAEAWRSGAAAWDARSREQFANDLRSPQLVAVDASSNRAKGDKDPAEWLPAADRCRYAEHWITVKHTWLLTVDPAEKSALAAALSTCPGM